MTVWLDANVIVRFLTGEPEALAERARRLLRRAAEGDVAFRVPTVAVAEVVWVLGSFYRVPREVIADRIRGFMLAEGVAVDDEATVLDAVRMMEDAGVSFVDAFIAASARARNERVATFDADFKRLGVDTIS